MKCDLAVHEDQEFSEWDDDLMSDICGPTLAKPIQNLLITLSQINSMQVNKVGEAGNIEALKDELKLLRAACVELWKKT